jgi:hypothetical protein
MNSTGSFLARQGSKKTTSHTFSMIDAASPDGLAKPMSSDNSTSFTVLLFMGTVFAITLSFLYCKN